MKEVASLIREYESEIIRKSQESMKENLVVLLKDKYDIVLTDDEWGMVMQMTEPSDWYSTAGKG